MLYDNNAELQSKIIAGIVQNEESREIAFAKLTKEHFLLPVFGEQFEILRKMGERGEEISIITAVQSRAAGYDAMRLTEMLFVRPKEMEYLVDRLIDIYAGNKALSELNNARESLEYHDTADVLDSLCLKLSTLSEREEKEQVIDGKEQSLRALKHIEEAASKEMRSKSVIYTRLKKLNFVSGGFESGDLVIISGRTGTGKSAFCQNLALSIAVEQKIPYLYINSEMSEKQINFRYAAMLSKDPAVTMQVIRAGELKDNQYTTVIEAMDRLYNSKMYSVSIPDLRIEKVLSVCRAYKRKVGLRAVAVDYVGRVDLTGKEDKEWQYLVSAARKLKTMAQQLDLVVFMVAQAKKDGGLQQASYMENEADLHLSLEQMDDAEMVKFAPYNYFVNVCKARNAPRCQIKMRFVGEKLLFIGEE
jgi:replicative DNA helicase